MSAASEPASEAERWRYGGNGLVSLQQRLVNTWTLSTRDAAFISWSKATRRHKISQAVKLLVAFRAEAHDRAGFSVLPVDTCVHRCERGCLGQKTRPDYGSLLTGSMTPDFNLDEWFSETIVSQNHHNIRRFHQKEFQFWTVRSEKESVKAPQRAWRSLTWCNEGTRLPAGDRAPSAMKHWFTDSRSKPLFLILLAPKNRWKCTLGVFAWFGLAAPLCGAEEPNFSPVLCLIMCAGGSCCSVMADCWMRTRNKFLCCRSNVWDLLASKLNTTLRTFLKSPVFFLSH